MESKRRAFPRFYFVSTADLLDILSNGNNPAKVRAERKAERRDKIVTLAAVLESLSLVFCCS